MRTPVNALAAICLFAISSIAMAQDSLHSIWRTARVDSYSAPPAAEIEQATRLIIDELQHKNAAKLEARWKELGFVREVHELANTNYTVVREMDDRREGRAFLVFGHGDGRLFLQTPHSRMDLHTGKITLQMMQEGGYTAGVWNVSPRRFERNGEMIKADMGKLEDSYFVAFSRAVARVYSGATHLQMHGFAQLKRSSDSAKTADVIVSSGTRKPEDGAYRLAVCLEKFYPGNVRLYPTNVTELGGTLNVSGATLREERTRGFIHLELSKPLRVSLRDSARERARITGCLKSLY